MVNNVPFVSNYGAAGDEELYLITKNTAARQQKMSCDCLKIWRLGLECVTQHALQVTPPSPSGLQKKIFA